MMTVILRLLVWLRFFDFSGNPMVSCCCWCVVHEYNYKRSLTRLQGTLPFALPINKGCKISYFHVQAYIS
ncbi:hypothetical protein TSUD_337100 [Trifolium subterraneum]|uniref:Secreted protein n=1 Tax=Trifolium subterraneum TaxID=3900 RepID=A0A2Z6MSC6_TRISU|nr:hypothetical protein TSUD_337100 [Trifolium subterraneum]